MVSWPLVCPIYTRAQVLSIKNINNNATGNGKKREKGLTFINLIILTMRKFTFCVTAVLTALAVIPAGNVRADVTKKVDVSIASGKKTGSVKTDVLQPGVYAFSGKDATFRVLNDKTDVTVGVTLEKAAALTIEWSIADAAKKDTLYSVTITTSSDADAKKVYTSKLAIQSNQAGNYDDKKLQDLALETSSLQGIVNKLTWDEYQEFAETGKVAALESAIDDLGARIADAVANYEAYNKTALDLYAELETEKANLTATYNTAADETKKISKDLYEGLVADVSAFKTEALAAYNAYEVTAASKETYEKGLADNAKTIKGSIATAIKAITSGSTNEFSNANVVAEIGNAKKAYNIIANDLFTLLQLAPENDADIYSDIYVQALTELGSTLREINNVEAENKAKYEAGEANDQTQADFIARLGTAIAPMQNIYDQYENAVTILRSNYVAANNDIKDINATVKAQIEDVYGKRSTVKDFYKDALASINNSVAELQKSVDQANADHKIEGTAPYCDGYDKSKKDILDAVAALNLKVVATVSEYDFNQATITALNDLQNSFITSDGKKGAEAEVWALVSTDKKYEAKNFYAATEASIQSSIDKVKADAAKAYTLTDDVKVKTAENFFNSLDLSKIEASIATYQGDAESALDSYNKVAADLADFAKNMEALAKTASNTAVTVDGSLDANVKTYADTIAVLNAAISSAQSALDAALAKTDAAHVKAINSIDTKAAKINGELIALNDAYAAKETLWNDNQLQAAKTRMLDDADRRIAELKLPAAFTAADYGKKAEDLNKKLGEYQTTLNDLSDEVDGARVKEAGEAIALLADIQTSLEALSKKVSELNTEADNAKTAYTAQKNAKAGIDAIITEYTAKLNGGTVGKTEYPGVIASYTGIRIDFNVEVADQQAEIDVIKDDLASSFAAETVVADLEDVKDEKGKVTKEGFNTRVNALKTAVDQLLTYAANETANDKANAEFSEADTKAKVNDLIAQAENDIKVATGDALTYFNGLLTNYGKEYSSITKANTDAYAAVLKDGKGNDLKYTDPAKNMSAQLASLKTRLAAVVTNINGLKDLAKANEDAHNAQVAASGKTTDLWNEVFAQVTGSEASSVHDSIITLLTGYKKDIIAYDGTVADAFKNGNSDKNSSEIEATLTNINNSIVAVKNGWNDLYAQAIAGDNQERKEAFDVVYQELKDTYTDCINMIEKMQKLDFAKDAELGTTAQDLLGYAEKIRNLKKDADAAYEATVAPTLFDPEEDYADQAELYMAEIENLTEIYTTQVNNAAQVAYANALVDANDAVEEVRDDLISVLGYSAKDAVAAVKPVQAHIDAAEAVKDAQDFAYTLDKTILPYFTDTLYTDLNNIANNEAIKVWDAKTKTAAELLENEATAIAGYAQPDGVDYSKQLATYKKDNYDASISAWNKSKTFGNFSTAYSKGLYVFENDNLVEVTIKGKKEYHTAIFADAYAYDYAVNANVNAYKDLLAAIAGAQDDLDDATAFVESLYAKNELSATLNQIDADIDNLSQLVDVWFDNDEADDYLADGLLDVNAIKSNIKDVYATALAKEKDAVDIAILALNYDYDKATAADLENEEIDAYKDKITAFSVQNSKIYSEYKDGKKNDKGEWIKDGKGNIVHATEAETQAAYLALEKEIGVAKSELVAIWNAAEIEEIKTGYETAIAAINADYDALTAQLAECHEPVNAEFADDVEAIKAATDAALAKFDQMAADNTLTLYADNIESDINAIKDSYKDLAKTIADFEAPYDVNDAKYEELKAQNAEYQTLLDEFVAMAENLNYIQKYSGTYSYSPFNSTKEIKVEYSDAKEEVQVQIQAAYIDYNNDWLEYNNENVLLTANSVLPLDPKSYLTESEARLKRYDAMETLINELAYPGSEYSKVERFIGANVFDDGVEETLRGNLDAIADIAYQAYWFVYSLNQNNNETTISKEIDGSDVKDKNGNPSTRKTNVLKEYNGILEAIASFRAQYAELNAEAAKDAKGDIGGDGVIDFEDISGMINIALSDTQNSDDIKVADLNGDGVVDVADVVMLVNVYVYGNKYGAAGAPFAGAPFRNVNVDETISLSNTENGVSVAFNNAYTYYAIQMDVTLPAGASIESFVNGERAQDFEIVSNQLDNGAWRVIMFSAAGKSIADKSGVLFNMAIESEGGQVIFDNIKVARISGLSKNLSGSSIEIPGKTAVPGIVADGVDADIFSAGGIKMNELGNGVNIIRTQSGEVKKVIAK